MRPAEVPEVPPIENTLTESLDLYDHLLWQLHMTETDELHALISEAIVQNLDEDGLLRVSLDDVAGMGPWPMEAVEKALAPRAGARPARHRRAHASPSACASSCACSGSRARPPT